MNKILGAVVALSILMLSGCASNHMNIQPILHPTQSPAMSSGYVAGIFSRQWQPGKLSFGLGIVNTATAEEYVMPFGADTVLPSDVVDEKVMIQLPPGNYRIAYWLIYSSKENAPVTRTDIAADSMTGMPFALAPGEVVFIGSHVAKMARGVGGNKAWTVHHLRMTPQSARKALLYGYPSFATQQMTCPSCLQ